MAEEIDPLISALNIIALADLSANDQNLLTRSLAASLTRIEAARYVHNRISRESSTRSLEDTLLSLKDDLVVLAVKINRVCEVPQGIELDAWERENGRCCVTGQTQDLRATYIVPPSLLDDEDLQSNGNLRPLLESYIPIQLIEQLDSFLKSDRKSDRLRNVWLMSLSAQHDFHHGHIQIRRTPFYLDNDFYAEEKDPTHEVWRVERTVPDQTRADVGYFNPSTPDSSRLPLPRRAMLCIHYALSLPLHFLAVEHQIKQGWPPAKQGVRTLGSTGIFFLRNFLRIIPLFIRRLLYKYARCDLRSSVRLLPLGLCLKTVRRPTMYNEANALRVVEKYTSVPAPRLIDSVPDGEKGLNVMTSIPGDRLDKVLYRMTHKERRELGRDLGKCIAQLRRISNNTPYQIANTLGEPAYDHRFEDGECGPYSSSADFANYLTEYFEGKRLERPLSALYKSQLNIYFTHSDLHQTNLFVQQGRLSGIVDWEHAGFKPEYWEYTKALWPYLACKEQKDIFTMAFDEDYEEELEAEMFLWKEKPVF